MANLIKIKRGLKINLPILERGELGYATDTNELFIGILPEPTLVTDNVLINDLSALGDYFTKSEIENLDGNGLTWNTTTNKFDIDNPFDPSGTFENLRAQATTAEDVGLGNVTNESKATMFEDPTFTGTVSGVTAAHVGLENVTNESKATMFEDPTFTGTVSGVTKDHVGLGNVENYKIATKEEAEAGTSTEKYMTPATTKDAILELSPPTDLTAVESHIDDSTIHFTQGDISITESQISDLQSYELADETILKSADIGVTVQAHDENTVIDANYETFDSSATYANLRAQATTAEDVGLGNVTNESKATMFTDPTFTGTVSGVTKSHVGLGNVTNESKATMFTDPTFTGTVTGVTKDHVGLGNVDNLQQIPLTQKGAANGVASLDSNSKVPLAQLPDTAKQQSYVVTNFSNLPTSNVLSGDKGYVTSTGDSYIWNGSSWLILAKADWENINLDYGNITNPPTTLSGTVNLTGNQTINGTKTFNNTITGSISGNAGTATSLETARTIGGVSFNGTSNINLPGVNTTGNQNTTGTAANVTGTVAIANGGTGATTAANARVNLGATDTGASIFTISNPTTNNVGFFLSTTRTEPVPGNFSYSTIFRTPAQVRSDIGAAASSHTHGAGDITSGTFADARIPNLAASKITSGSFSVSRGGTGRSTLTSNTVLVGNGTSAVTLASRSGIDTRSTFPPDAHDLSSHSDVVFSTNPTTGDILKWTGSAWSPAEIVADDIPNLAAGKITSGTFADARIPNLNASKINAGTFADARIPNLGAGKITSGTFAGARIPNLAASKITSGTFADARIPNLNASKITAGTLPLARGGTGATTAGNARVNLGATDTGASIFTVSNPTANGNFFLRVARSEPVSGNFAYSPVWRTAAGFRSDIGAGTSNLSLGETSATAYRGDRGKTAFDHSQVTTGAVHGATTVGNALFRIANNATSNKFIRVNTNNTLTYRTGAQTRSDIGAAASSHTHAAGDITSGHLSVGRGRQANSSSSGVPQYNGHTRAGGRFYGGTTNPTSTSGGDRMNYNGRFHATQIFEGGTRLRNRRSLISEAEIRNVNSTSTRAISGQRLAHKFQVVNSLPASPLAGVFYFIRE